MPDYSNETLTILIKKLSRNVDTGFKGVHKRQDLTNGRIRKLEIWKAGIVAGMTILGMLISWGVVKIFQT